METKTAETKQSRRDFLIKSAGAAVGLAVGGTYAGRAILERQGEFTNRTRLVEDEVERLGIKQSKEEKKRWESLHFEPITDESSRPEIVKQRFQKVFRTMYESENPHFAHAAKELLKGNDAGEINIVFRERFMDVPNAPMGIAPVLEDEKIKWYFSCASEKLAEYSPVHMAEAIVHEVKHIENSKESIASMGSISVEEKYKREMQRLTSPEGRVAEEARAYAAQAVSYIYEYGLWYREGVGSGEELIAAEFLKNGKDPDSPVWRQTVAGTIGCCPTPIPTQERMVKTPSLSLAAPRTATM